MTVQEMGRQYQMAIKIVKEYVRWGLRGEVEKRGGLVDDADLERLSMVMTPHESGEVERYRKLLLKQEGSWTEKLDYLRHKKSENG